MAKGPKKPKAAGKWAQFPDTQSSYDAVFEAMTDAAREQFPGDIMTGGELAQRVLCLPVPALSVRFLLQQEGWPLERFVQIVGARASGKSSLGYEIMWWHRVCRGNGIIVQVEPKPAPELLLSLLRWDKKAVHMHDAHDSLEQWFEVLRYWVNACRKSMDGVKDKPGSGRVFPVCFMVDSLTAVLDTKLSDQFDAGDGPSTHFSTQARFLSDFMKYLPGKLVGYPFSWIGINHVKEKVAEGGKMPGHGPGRTVPGGVAPQYHETLEIEIKRKGKVKRADEVGYELRLEMIKNSLAPEQWINVEKVSWIDLEDKDPETGHYRSKTMFDWHRASIDVLHQVIKDAGKSIKRKLNDLLGLTVSEQGTVTCDALGLKKNTSMRTAGELLELKLSEEPAFADELYPLLGIRRRTLFKPGVDYRQQIIAASVAAKAADVDLPHETQEMPALPQPTGGEK